MCFCSGCTTAVSCMIKKKYLFLMTSCYSEFPVLRITVNVNWVNHSSFKVRNGRHSNIDNAFGRILLGGHQHIYFNPMCWEESWHVCLCTVNTKWNKWKGLFDISVQVYGVCFVILIVFLWIKKILENIFRYYKTK